MNIVQRLDRMIVRLCYVRNLITRSHSEIDFALDLHGAEAATNELYESAITQSEEIQDDNSGN